MATLSDLIDRVASTCFSQPRCDALLDLDDDEGNYQQLQQQSKSADKEEDEVLRAWEEEGKKEEEKRAAAGRDTAVGLERVREMESMMTEVFDAVSSMKRAYVGLQRAHSPWDPDKIRTADEAVVAELKKIARLRDRFRRNGLVNATVSVKPSPSPLKEAVAPYEAALEDLKKELKARETEVESLKEKLRYYTPSPSTTSSRRKGKHHYSSSKRFSSSSTSPLTSSISSPATAEMFEACMDQVRSESKSFTAHLISLMRAARWDMAATARSIVEGDFNCSLDLSPQLAKHAVEAYVNRRMFDGFENETFYIEGTLTSLLNPAEHRHECLAQFFNMRGMDPTELLGITPECQFGRFAAKKYLSIVHAKMEESLFGGGTEQRKLVIAGGHPRTAFYGDFLQLAKSVWLLHLLAFALDPLPAQFEAGRQAEFQPEYMDTVVRFASSGKVPAGWVVGFGVSPGFKLGNGAIVRARVYVVPKL